MGTGRVDDGPAPTSPEADLQETDEECVAGAADGASQAGAWPSPPYSWWCWSS